MEIVDQLDKQELEELHAEILLSFKPVADYELDDYYGVAWMSMESSDSVQLRLQYSYKGKHPLNGKPKTYTSTQIDDAVFDLQILLALRKARVSTAKGLSSRERLKKLREEKKDTSNFPGAT